MIKIPKEIKTQLKRQAYYERSLHYYIAARHAFSCKFFPLSGNLVHHTLEMLLHSGLAQKYSFEMLKNMYSKHDLNRMWNEFKNLYPDAKLKGYDQLISKYNKWKDLKYPNDSKSNTIMIFDLRKNDESRIIKPRYKKSDEYRLNLEELDEFFTEISLLTGINSQFVKTVLFTEEAKRSYRIDNHHQLWKD